MFAHSVSGMECARDVPFSPLINPGIRLSCFSADVLKKCALIALHVMAEEGRDGDGFQVPELKRRMENRLPKESTASHKGNMCNDPLHVIGLHGSGDKISLFLQDIGSWQRWH